MKNISIAIDSELFRRFSIACAETGLKKKTLLINLIKQFIGADNENEEEDDEENKEIEKIVKKRMKGFKLGKSKTISHKDAWK